MIAKTVLRPISFILFLLIQQLVFAQSLSRIEKLIERKEFDKFKELLDKSEEKDSSRIGVKYFFSKYYSQQNESFYDIDSADLFIRKALSLYENATTDQIEDINEDGLTIASIKDQQRLVNSMAYERAVEAMTILALNDFISNYETAEEKDSAVYLRDSLAFDAAKSQAKSKGFLDFYNTYSESVFKVEAKAIYDSLLFYENTANGKLASYETFIEQNPDTPFRAKALAHIYKLRTREHHWQTYMSFVNDYPESSQTPNAYHMAYHIDKVKTLAATAQNNLSDSLKKAYRLEQEILIPQLHHDKIGLMTKKGDWQLPPTYSDLPSNYKCHGISDPVFLAEENDSTWNVYNRSGSIMVSDVSAGKIELFGNQAFSVEKNDQQLLYHLSGQLLTRGYDQAQLINKKWINITQGGKQALLNFQAETLLSAYDDIEVAGSFYIVEKDDKLYVYNDQALLSPEEKSGIIIEDYELIKEHLLIFDGDKEALLTPNLDFKVEWGDHKIYADQNEWVIEKEHLTAVFNDQNGSSSKAIYQFRLSNNGWVGFKADGRWTLQSRQHADLTLTNIDLLTLLQDHTARVYRKDSSFLQFQNGKAKTIEPESVVSMLKGTSGLNHSFLIITNQNKKDQVVDSSANDLPLQRYRDLYVLNDSLLRYTYKGKSGLVNSKGESILKAVYNTMELEGELVFLLKDALIGCFDLLNGTLLEPAYNQKVERMGKGYLVKKRDDYFWLNEQKQDILNQGFMEVKSWNDTSVWVKNESFWSLRSMSANILIDSVNAISVFHETDNEQIFSVHKNGKYGLVSNMNDEIVPTLFHDIMKIGNNNESVVFCEQRLEVAEFYVVTYYSLSGDKIISQAYRDHQYSKIYCDQ